jgi:hypothetical protein
MTIKGLAIPKAQSCFVRPNIRVIRAAELLGAATQKLKPRRVAASELEQERVSTPWSALVFPVFVFIHVDSWF